MKKAFTMIELIFVIVIIGILAAVAIPKYLSMVHNVHESHLIAFVHTLNRTTGNDLWGISISSGHNGKISDLNETEDSKFLSKYIDIPIEINASSIDLTKCGNGEYKTIMEINKSVMSEDYNITCKDGTATTAPYFRLIRVKDDKVLVSRD